MDRYVVIGNPVAHSRSPEIHARFARATGEDLVYERLLVEPGDFARAAREFFASGGRGANVTLPFKVDAFDFAQVRTPRAAQAGAVNTLAAREGRILGDNTDGAGLVPTSRPTSGSNSRESASSTSHVRRQAVRRQHQIRRDDGQL